MSTRTLAAGLTLAALIAVGPDGPGLAAGPSDGKPRQLTIFYTAEARGTLEPCGCTSDPLGDLARYAALVRGAARSGPVLLLDGGALSFPESSGAKEKMANALRARFLGRTLDELAKPGLFAAGLADGDLHGAVADVVPRRLAVNFSGSRLVAPSVLKTMAGVRVGIFGVADPALAARAGAQAEDPVSAAKAEVTRLRRAGAELVIALVPLDKPVARRLARSAAPDIVVLGRQVGNGQARAEQVGSSFLVAAAEELERVGRLDLVLRGAGPLVDAGGPEAAALRRVEIDQAAARLDEELRTWSTGGGDPAFIAAKRHERQALADERKNLDAPWSPPPSGSYFTNRLIPLRRSLPRDGQVAAEMRHLDTQVAAINLSTAAPPAPREPGRPYFVGAAKCGACHKDALAFWKTTVHASAWRTLVEAGKENDYRCTSCHVTGYGQVGGTNLGHTDHLRDVQCEVCHGPGSAHVDGKGLEDPPAVHRDTPASTCTGCHTTQHSDTFQYEAYLRDVLGPGHGAPARKKLGDGPTGHTLRTAALARAKLAGAAQAKTN
jgi:hypothetical protein